MSKLLKRLIFTFMFLCAIGSLIWIWANSKEVPFEAQLENCTKRVLKSNTYELSNEQAEVYCTCYLKYLREGHLYFQKSKSTECLNEAKKVE